MRLLLIEDDIHLCEILHFELEHEGYTVDICNDGREGLTFGLQPIYDLILLDQMLPAVNGREILRQLRQEGIAVPVIFLTALGESADKITGLDLGADDYIVKPFDTGELLARIRSNIRRSKKLSDPGCLQYGGLTYHPSEKKLLFQNSSYLLSGKEGELLELFLAAPEKVLSRTYILSKIWGMAVVEDGNLDNYIYILRKRLKSTGCCLKITTIHGTGYCLEPNPSGAF